MSRSLNNEVSSGSGYRALRDYGATGSAGNVGSAVPDVNFAFSPTEYMSLSENITQTTKTVKASTHLLKKATKQIGTRLDNATLREEIHKTQESSNAKIKTSTNELKRLMAVVRNGDKQQKLNVDKLTTDFKHIVNIYSELQQDVASKMKLHLLPNASQQDDRAADAAINNQSNMTPQQFQTQQQLIGRNLEFENSMTEERAQRVERIERDVLDINQIMVDLSTMVDQQSADVDRIEDNVERATGSVEDGLEQLTAAARSQAKYRKKVLLLLLIAVILGLIVTAIIVSSLKS